MFTNLIYFVFALLVAANAAIFFSGKLGIATSRNEDFWSFQKRYLWVYSLIMLADWLQGPYLYRLYEHYGFLREQIAALYICSIMSSMVSGPLLGRLADQYGRRMLCMVCCACLALSCTMKLSASFYILMLSALIGGASTSLLFSAFESWMVAEHTTMGFPSEWLGRTYTLSTLCNGVMAVVAGLLAYIAADCCGHYPHRPFLLAIVFAAAAATRMASTWAERVAKDDTLGVRSRECLAGLRALRDPRVCFLGLVQSCFEAAGFAFIFLWTGSVDVADDWHPPLGLIFGCFMLAIMLGGCVFRLSLAHRTVPSMLSLCLPAAATFLAVGVVSTSPPVLFLAFVFFQLSSGVYFPSVGTMRAHLLPDTNRAAVMGWLRVPMNILVIVILLLVSSVSHPVLFGIGALLCFAASGFHNILSRSLPPELLQPTSLPSATTGAGGT
eukprot:m.42709 g.42709  ORF g.42709 m.42709 type:complete len:441 (+) comp10691_c0_seq1:279-1601(+)